MSTNASYESDPAFPLHHGGKIEVRPTVRVRDRAGLSLAYTPGVARVSTAVAEEPELAYRYTWKGGTVAVVTDGSAVLGLGDIGPLGALPVMEGKALLFKEFGGVDAVPICLDTGNVDEIVDTVTRIAPAFGGINLEDISAPRCFDVEDRLDAALDIPVFHDDQHGTAVVALAALRGALRLTERDAANTRVAISGAGAAGVAVARILNEAGVGDVVVSDSHGLLHPGRDELTAVKEALVKETNVEGLRGTLADGMRGADVFIGVSGGRVPEEAVAAMADDPVVFALANPDPEVHPEVAGRYSAVVATGRSDYPNQINNVLAFPGIFRGALGARAKAVTSAMKLAAADALADLVDAELSPTYVIPSAFDDRVVPAVSRAVAAAADG